MEGRGLKRLGLFFRQMIMMIKVLFLIALSSCSSNEQRYRVTSIPWVESLNKDLGAELERDAEALLIKLIRAKSVNPMGHEDLVVELIAEALDELGIQSKRQQLSPGRSNLYALLKPKSPIADQKGALCLLSHSDVVPAESSEWTQDPWSGAVHEGYIWGRGALDMKGITAIHIASLRAIKRALDSDLIHLKRPVALIVVADEEVDNIGMSRLVKERWEQLKCSHVLNEGGYGIKDMLFKGQDVVPISVGEKGVLWVKLVVKGPSGHGSVPRSIYAPKILLDALERIRSHQSEVLISEPIREILGLIGQDYGGLKGLVLQSELLTDWFALKELLSLPESAAGVTNTFHITGLNAAQGKPNVVPSEATATLDIRMLAGISPQDVLAELKAIINDSRVKIEVIHSIASDLSPWKEDEVFRALIRHSKAAFPKSVIGPVTSVGFTDSTYARKVGARAYGWAPFMLSREELTTMHGADERLSIEQLHIGVRAMLGVLLETSSSPKEKPTER